MMHFESKCVGGIERTPCNSIEELTALGSFDSTRQSAFADCLVLLKMTRLLEGSTSRSGRAISRDDNFVPKYRKLGDQSAIIVDSRSKSA
jgi:hypothetical protein